MTSRVARASFSAKPAAAVTVKRYLTNDEWKEKTGTFFAKVNFYLGTVSKKSRQCLFDEYNIFRRVTLPS